MLKQISLLIFFILFLAGVACNLLSLHFFYIQYSLLDLPKGKVTYEVKAGTSATHLAQDLQDKGWIQSSKEFQYFTWWRRQEKHIQAGLYALNPDLQYGEFLRMLTQGQVIIFPITFINGQTFKDTWLKLQKAPHLTQKNIDLQTLLSNLKIKQKNPEGLFYPDTYFYSAGEKTSTLLKKAHYKLSRILAQEWRNRAHNLPYKNVYQALITASLIERETSINSERKHIASVLVRRLQKGIRLQIDSSVIYGLGKNYKGKLTKVTLLRKTPYNTYNIRGLPPTPIALVKRASIHAALHPAHEKYLYFVAKGDGHHIFSATLAEHNHSVTKYQLKRSRDYRSRP